MNADDRDLILPLFAQASGAHVTGLDGARYVDLINGFGSVFLGHGEPRVVAALKEQADELWSCARLPTVTQQLAMAAVARVLPERLSCAGLYSTGMEAAEFALRIAATCTGRRRFVGFARGMHGKSAMTASLCWENAPLPADHLATLPFPREANEDEILDRLEGELLTRDVAAVFIEPLQGSHAGHEASARFLVEMAALCRQHGTLCVFDEILTGLWRTGSRFQCERAAVCPDVLLFAKSMGNGFPVSAVAVAEGIEIPPAALPGSTFSTNPLACAVVTATLEAMLGGDMAARVAAIERVVRRSFEADPQPGTLRGRGACWVLELDPRYDPQRALRGLRRRRILATLTGPRLRLLPAATIPLETLACTCADILDACDEALQ